MFRKAREILCKACSPVEFVILMLLVRRDTRRWRRHLAELREKYSLPVGELALVLGVLAVLVCTPASAIAGQSAEAALMRLSLDGACQLVGIPCDYESRYDLLLQLCKEGVVVFKSPDTGGFPEMSCLAYSGTAEQNRKFIRNIVVNRHLFKNGVLPAGNVKRWRVVY